MSTLFFRLQIVLVVLVGAAPSVVKIAKVRKLTFAMDLFLEIANRPGRPGSSNSQKFANSPLREKCFLRLQFLEIPI
tara:strand:- start:847 stop:1077 length:231 start_codon:yes stop_codon:yes gene_type:complete